MDYVNQYLNMYMYYYLLVIIGKIHIWSQEGGVIHLPNVYFNSLYYAFSQIMFNRCQHTNLEQMVKCQKWNGFVSFLSTLIKTQLEEF